jgi:hypothetical protein
MFKKFFSRIPQLFAATSAAVLLLALVPQAVFAAVPSFSFTTIKVGESVTIHAINFPQNTNFTARMDYFGNLAIGGTIVGTVNSGTGTFDATFNIPASLKDAATIAMRLDSASGWYSYNWFTNKTGSTSGTSSTSCTKPTIQVIAVVANKEITVQANCFPANQDFKIRVGPYYTFFTDYVIMGYKNSGSGGSFQFNVTLPAAVKDVDLVTVRLDSPEKEYAYTAFKNVDKGTVSPTPVPVTTKATIEIVAVDANKEITVQAYNFPASQTFEIRVGPYNTFFKDYVVVGTVNSGSGGSFKFNVQLPSIVKDVNLVTVRLDSAQKVYAYNAFKNVDKGSVSPQPTPVPVTGTDCKIVSTVPNTTLQVRADFDAVWTVKNTGTTTWDMHAVDYKYVSGTKMHKYNSLYDLPQTVKPGESVKIIVDMLAPSTAGTYTENWAIVQGSTTLCNLPITVVVK